jgi:DNA-binding LytR/AlgR family response regulator
MKKVLIIEDEIPAAKRMAGLLTEIAPEFEIAGYCDSIESAVSFLKTQTPDLILLDIQLGDGLSFEIFKQTEVHSPVIFTTAYDEYIFRAFELNSIDYLMKPVSREALEKSIIKYRKFHDQLIPDKQLMSGLMDQREKVYKQRFLVSSGTSLLSVRIPEIAYFFSVEKSVFLMTNAGKSYDLDYSLDKLETILSDKEFFRVNRQFLVNINAIKRISVLSKSRIRIVLEPDFKEEVYVSNARSHEFRLWLDR